MFGSKTLINLITLDPALRPVLIIGPLNECVATKLLQEFPGEFIRCLPEAMHCSQATLEQGLRDSLYVDYRRKGSYFECTTVHAVKDICAKVNNFFFFFSYLNYRSFNYNLIILIPVEYTLHFGHINCLVRTSS